ncbi:ABC transporter substrate-binding protein [uncultured Serinicoccus sp.]|uniref:ABC transporter substrate-binding protein n=1 Tax=uncultured Serinicoccus sp. TaxID=735514 RepID=UPI0026250D5B|nr:ABC transporter substrate-binding protein [uncultured Serinicoccus sp.]
MTRDLDEEAPMRKGSLAWVTISALSLAACSGGASGSDAEEASDGGAAAADPTGGIVFMDSAPNPDLDPAGTLSDSSFSQAVLYALYDRILTFDGAGEIQEGLATEWSFVDDELRTFEFTLREGVTFHDGEALTAEVVKANFERTQELGDAAGATVRAAAGNIDSIEAADELTVRVHLQEPDGGFPFALATQFGMMLSPNSLDGSTGVDLEAVGTGPYELVSFTPNNTTTMERFEEFWGGTEGRPDTFEVQYVTDDQTRLNALRSGQANVVLLTPRQVSEAEGTGLEVKVNETSSMWVMYENTSEALDDVRVRQALMHAIDRESISSALQFDTGQPSVQLAPPGHPAFLEDADDLYPYDPDKARDLLAEAGHPDGLDLEYVLLNTPEYVQITEVLQQQFAEVGITVDIVTLDISQAGQFMSGETGDLMLARWGGRADLLKTFEVVVGPEGTYAPGGVATPQLEEAIVEARGYAADDPERVNALQAVNRETVESAANIPVVTRSNIYAYNEGCFSGLDPYLASGSNDWRDVTIAPDC